MCWTAWPGQRPPRRPAWMGSKRRSNFVVLPQFACCWSCLGGIEDASTKEFEAGSAVHRPLQQLDPADLSLDGAGGPGQVERGLYGSDVLAQLGGKARKRRGARGGPHIIELLAALPSQKEGQPLCGRDRRSERGYLVQQPRHERSVGLGQRVGPTHQQAGHAAARRPSPSLSLIRGEHPAHVGLSLAPSCPGQSHMALVVEDGGCWGRCG